MFSSHLGSFPQGGGLDSNFLFFIVGPTSCGGGGLSWMRWDKWLWLGVGVCVRVCFVCLIPRRRCRSSPPSPLLLFPASFLVPSPFLLSFSSTLHDWCGCPLLLLVVFPVVSAWLGFQLLHQHHNPCSSRVWRVSPLLCWQPGSSPFPSLPPAAKLLNEMGVGWGIFGSLGL